MVDASKKFKGVVVAEGQVDEVVSFDTLDQLQHFAAGVNYGASLYGAGGCAVYAHHDREEWPEECAEEIEQALEKEEG